MRSQTGRARLPGIQSVQLQLPQACRSRYLKRAWRLLSLEESEEAPEIRPSFSKGPWRFLSGHDSLGGAEPLF